MLSGIVLSITALGNILLALMVVLKNYKKPLHWALVGISFALTTWLVAGYFSNLDTSSPLFWNRAVFIGPIIVPVALIIFVQELIGSKLHHSNNHRLSLVGIAVFFLVLLTTPLFVAGIQERVVDGRLEGYDLIRGFVYYLFLVYLVTALVLATSILYRSYKLSNGLEKAKLQYVLIGTSLAILWSVLFSVVLVLFTKSSRLSSFGPLGGLILVSFYVYAIVRHRLFDIRLVVVRSMGYLLSILFLGAIYGFLAFNIISDLIFGGSNITIWQKTVYTLLAVIIAFTFQPLKKFFDKITNSIFYKDAYDSQALLDSFNRSLLTTIDLDKLLKTTANTINEYIKSEYLLFGIKDFKGSPQRVVGTLDIDFAQEDIEKVRKITPLMQAKSIIVDDLPEDQANLKNLLIANGISALVRLTDTPDKKKEGMGYIVLGAKKSGGRYSAQDIRNLEIIADILVIAVQNSLRFEEIQSFNKTLQEKIDDATKKLRSANQRLIELDQTKDDFISMASHQLRTPLTSIKGYVSMVIEGDAGKVSKKQVELLDQAFVSAQRMVYLIADLLNVSRLRTGKFVIDPKQTNLTDIIEGEITQLIETAKGRNLKLVYNKPKSFPVLMLDEVKTRQVIMNFIDNAIYYTPSGGHISVSLADLGESIEFIVTDDGIGVPKAEQHQLFSKFYRANNAKKARPDGTGLGLFMAKKVIVAQGGSIIFKSAENKGSTFGFAFIKKPLLPENFKGVIK